MSTEWRRYILNFDDLDTFRAPVAPAFKVAEISGIEFVVPQNNTFELHLDDIAFVK